MRFKSLVSVALACSALASLAACTAPGAADAPDVYTSAQVNQAQAATVVNILAVLPAKVQEDNSANQRTAGNAGAAIGAIAGALLGGLAAHGGGGGAALGGLAGGLIGSAAGGVTPANVLVEGVSLTYTVGMGGPTMNSVEVGHFCQFHAGQAVMVTNGPGVTRIQPNAACPPPSA